MENDTRCANCRHYMRHYVFMPESNGYIPVDCGHCMYPRIKYRRPEDHCNLFTNKNA